MVRCSLERPGARAHRFDAVSRAVILSGLLLGAGLLMGPAASAAGAEAAEPLTISDVVALLEAGVGESLILKQMERTGTRFVLTVEAMLRLKAAGASDAFLEAMIETNGPAEEAPGGATATEPGPAPESPGDDGEYNIRIYSAENEDGEPIIHITNLDENGRRIGGEIPPEARRNVIEAREAPPAPPPDAADGYGEPDGVPVIVNVYPPASADPQPAAAPPPYGPYVPAVSYPRYVPYGYGYVPRPHHHHPYGYGYYGGYYGAPPGSYSHYVTYHRPAGSHFFSRYTFTRFNHHAYRSPASVRNRALFRKR